MDEGMIAHYDAKEEVLELVNRRTSLSVALKQ